MTPTVTATPYFPDCQAGDYTGLSCDQQQVSVQLNGSSADPGADYSWTSNCPNASFDDPTLPNAVLTIDSYTSSNQPVSCVAQLTVTTESGSNTCFANVSTTGCTFDCLGTLGGTAEIDRCGVCDGDGQSCVECQSVEIKSKLFDLDGAALRQRDLVKYGLRYLSSVGKRNKQVKNFVKKTSVRAEELYVESWVLSWQFPQEIQSCDDSPFCVKVSTLNEVSAYNANSEKLLQLTLDVAKKIRQVSKSSSSKLFVKRLQKRGRGLQKFSTTASAEIPASFSSCE